MAKASQSDIMRRFGHFNSLANDYFSAISRSTNSDAKKEEMKMALLDVMQETMVNFSRDAETAAELNGCPDGWKDCGGVCIPASESC